MGGIDYHKEVLVQCRNTNTSQAISNIRIHSQSNTGNRRNPIAQQEALILVLYSVCIRQRESYRQVTYYGRRFTSEYAGWSWYAWFTSDIVFIRIFRLSLINMGLHQIFRIGLVRMFSSKLVVGPTI